MPQLEITPSPPGLVEERTAAFNRIRGLIAALGYVLPNGVAQLRRRVVVATCITLSANKPADRFNEKPGGLAPAG